MSSAVSSSSQGSGHDDVDAVGHVYMWGEGIGDGVLGGGSHKLGQSLGAKVDATLPKAVESAVVLDVQHVACGSRHAALVTRQGEIFCWGEELGGRLGHGIDADFAHPQLIETLAHMTIGFTSCGEYSSCAVSLAGELFTWGEDTHAIGLLGRGNGVGHWLPKRVGGPLEGLCVVMISCGPWHTALVTSLGQLFTFGDGTFGVLGHGDLQSISVPKEVESLKGLQTIKVSCGVWHSAAVVEVIESSNPCSNCSPRKLFTWGDGDKGRLGHEDKKQKLVPTCVAALIEHNFRDVACGHSLTAGLTLSGQVFTMGSTVYGQLGNPNADGKAPALVEKLHDVFIQEIACGAFHFVALTSKGEVYTWGKGANGQLGHGDSSDRKVPTLVEALKDKEVKSISCGGSITAAICLHKWVSGSDQSVCSGCKQPFGFTRKKHNCYNCGLVLCHSCSSKKAIKASMAPNPIKPHRVCDSCYIKMKKANYSTMSPSSASVNKRLGSLKPYVGNRHLQDVMDPTLLKSEPSSSKLSTLEKSKLNENKIHSEKSKRFESKNSRFSPSQTRPSLRSGYVRQYISASVPQSRIVSGATSPVASRRLSPCSIISTPTVDGMALAMMGDYDSIRIENLACEVTKLRLQVRSFCYACGGSFRRLNFC
ncbi:hypothetical protein KP509_09G040000 [Ceratopteris richardii]|uniref:FYVE-type domain-containing protein n=1 Tax=Ceratopteris richardii TaxID=49495 RepID=A0A8T2U0P8_CERRI|nr:hypothetical protein KP509_09G040000 [Ceratopteris richardii]